MNANIPDCKFSNDTVPYMYGELSARDASAFESHVLECVACTDEFAAFANARYEVYDWKQTEFEPLATPVFDVPFEVAAAGVHWIERLRAAFATNWAVPGLAFGAFAVVFIVAITLFLSAKEDSYVAAVNGVNSPVTNRGGTEMPTSPVKAKDPKIEATPFRTSATPRPAEKRVVRNSIPSSGQSIRALPASAQNRTVPRLNEFVEDEDDSLRLAQLFEDIDTSE